MFKRLMMFLALLGMFGSTQIGWVSTAAADITLPSYAAGGDVKAKIESTGKRVTDTVGLIVAVLCILGIIVSAGFFGTGKADEGKRWLFGSITGLIVGGFAYGIAALVI